MEEEGGQSGTKVCQGHGWGGGGTPEPQHGCPFAGSRAPHFSPQSPEVANILPLPTAVEGSKAHSPGVGGALVVWKLRATLLPPMSWASDLGPRVGEAQELPDGFSLLGEDEEDEEDEEGKLTPVRPGGLVAVFWPVRLFRQTGQLSCWEGRWEGSFQDRA